jgi:hypothetical protein
MQLDGSMFAVEVDGVPASREAVFPGWDANDRLGVIVTEPLGSVGASLLIQLAIVAFYDFRPERRAESIQYPEIYAFHVGGSYGDLSYFDFWPERKEVRVENDARAILTAINDRAITRLVVVDSPPAPVQHRRSELAPALDRLRSVYAYDPSGQVAEADLVITGLDAGTEMNAKNTIDAERALAATIAVAPKAGAEEERARFTAQFSGRISEVSPQAREHVRTRRAAILSNGCASETYRAVPVEQALNMLTAVRRHAPLKARL